MCKERLAVNKSGPDKDPFLAFASIIQTKTVAINSRKTVAT
jgi:hypothetical protein